MQHAAYGEVTTAMGTRPASIMLLAALLIAIGTGAAVGPVLASRLSGRASITSTQALALSLPLIASHGITYHVGGATSSGYLPALAVPAGARPFSDLTSDKVAFTVAVDLLPTGSKFDVLLPVANAANNPLTATISLDVPEGILVDAEAIGAITVATGPGAVVTVGGQLNVGRTTASTWEVWAPAFMRDHESAVEAGTGNQITGYSGILLHVALPNRTPPGFYSLRGRIEPVQT